jgi:hypothetical protein
MIDYRSHELQSSIGFRFLLPGYAFILKKSSRERYIYKQELEKWSKEWLYRVAESNSFSG